jgi:hypothetical protein
VSFVLHDLGKDIEETTDVSRNHPGMVKEMHALLKKYVREGRSNGRRWRDDSRASMNRSSRALVPKGTVP